MMIVYEDQLVHAFLSEQAATKGHVLVQPKKPVTHLSELSSEESAHLFLVASYSAAILFQGLQAEGTNIICNEDEEQLTLHVIARRADDGVDFQWQPQELDEGVMAETEARIKDATFSVGRKSEVPEPEPDPDKPLTPEQEAIKEAEEEENYLIRQLLRVP